MFDRLVSAEAVVAGVKNHMLSEYFLKFTFIARTAVPRSGNATSRISRKYKSG